MTIQQLEALLAPAPPPSVTADQARQQVLGGMKMLARMAGMGAQEDVQVADLFVRRVHELEQTIARLEQEIGGYRRGLMAISAAVEAHTDPFGLKPASKWTKTELAAWTLAAGETMTWAAQRADNLLDPAHFQPIARDPESVSVDKGASRKRGIDHV